MAVIKKAALLDSQIKVDKAENYLVQFLINAEIPISTTITKRLNSHLSPDVSFLIDLSFEL